MTDLIYYPQGPLQSIHLQSIQVGSPPLHELVYTVDPLLNVETITETIAGTLHSPAYAYGYDGVSRLTDAAYPAGLGLPGSESFPYDAAGNRDDDPHSATPWAYDASNRIQASPETSYAFDPDGNLATRTTPSGTETFTFDATNRLRTWTDGTTTASYAYDPFGRRIRKTVGTTTTGYLWDGDRLLAEYDAAGNRTARYAYAGGFAPLQYATSDGASGEHVYDVHTDHLDTPKLLTDATGSPVWRAAHEAFGRAYVDEDPDGDLNEVSFHVRFPGQYYDDESGLHYNRHRYFDPSLGRYLNEDPLGLGGGANRFIYGAGNAIARIDPLGLDWIEYTGQRVTYYGGDVGDRSDPKRSCPASSGLPGYQDPSQQSTPDAGPVPEGDYSVNLKPDPSRVASADRNTGDLTPSPVGGIERVPRSFTTRRGSRFVYPGWGSWRARLDPQKGTSTFGRTSLYLHDSDKGFTHGCVETCSGLLNDLKAYRDAGNSSIDVRVNYTDPNTHGATGA